MIVDGLKFDWNSNKKINHPICTVFSRFISNTSQIFYGFIWYIWSTMSIAWLNIELCRKTCQGVWVPPAENHAGKQKPRENVSRLYRESSRGRSGGSCWTVEQFSCHVLPCYICLPRSWNHNTSHRTHQVGLKLHAESMSVFSQFQSKDKLCHTITRNAAKHGFAIFLFPSKKLSLPLCVCCVFCNIWGINKSNKVNSRSRKRTEQNNTRGQATTSSGARTLIRTKPQPEVMRHTYWVTAWYLKTS